MRGSTRSSAYSARPALRRPLDRLDDPQVARAAAQVARDREADLLAARPRRALQQLVGDEQHPRRAVAALGCARVREGLLQRVEPRAAGEPLDRRDLRAVAGGGETHARQLPPPPPP